MSSRICVCINKFLGVGISHVMRIPIQYDPFKGNQPFFLSSIQAMQVRVRVIFWSRSTFTLLEKSGFLTNQNWCGNRPKLIRNWVFDQHWILESENFEKPLSWSKFPINSLITEKLVENYGRVWKWPNFLTTLWWSESLSKFFKKRI